MAVHYKPLEAIVGKIRVILVKNANVGDGNGSNRETTNQYSEITDRLSPKLMKLHFGVYNNFEVQECVIKNHWNKTLLLYMAVKLSFIPSSHVFIAISV